MEFGTGPRSRPLVFAATLAAAVTAVSGGMAVASAANAANAACSAPSLVAAISSVSAYGGTVSLAARCVYTLTAPNNATDGGTGLPVIKGDVTVQGNGATIARTGTAAFRFFDVAVGGTLAVDNLTLKGGLADDGIDGGGAIDSHGTLTAAAVTFTGNQAPAATGTSGGAIDSSGTLTVTGSAFTGNTAQEGAGLLSQATTTITNSTFSGNIATDFGGGGLVTATGTTTVSHDTFSGNAGPGGGAIDNDATVHVSDSTFTGNNGGTNGGGAIQNFGTMTITQSTVSGNTSQFGADLHNDGTSLSVTMSIIANGVTGSNCSGLTPVTDGGHNLDSGTSCGFTATGSMINAAPRLGPLANNGGPTPTMALLSGSPAIDAIPAATPGCIGGTDQRGVLRPQGPGCDIGAYELSAPGGAIRGYAGKCVDDTAASTANGTKIQIWSCNGRVWQRWQLASNGQLQIFGKCIAPTGSGGLGSKMQLANCSGDPNQGWTHKSNGAYVLKSNSLCLADPGSSTRNGTQLELLTCTGAANQRWSLP